MAPNHPADSSEEDEINDSMGSESGSESEEVVTSQSSLSIEKTVVDEKEFSKLYPWALKDGNAHKNLVSKELWEIMEDSLFHLEKSKLEELEGEWRNQFLGEAELLLVRISILQKQMRMVFGRV